MPSYLAFLIEMHIESLRESGEEVPEPHSFVEKVAV
jgi:predicted RNase H-like HicB family nuclease